MPWPTVGEDFPYAIADSSLENTSAALSMKPSETSLAFVGQVDSDPAVLIRKFQRERHFV